MSAKCPNCGGQLYIADDERVVPEWYCEICYNYFLDYDVIKEDEPDLFGECSICGEKAVLPDEWVNVCPNCMFFGSLK